MGESVDTYTDTVNIFEICYSCLLFSEMSCIKAAFRKTTTIIKVIPQIFYNKKYTNEPKCRNLFTHHSAGNKHLCQVGKFHTIYNKDLLHYLNPRKLQS